MKTIKIAIISAFIGLGFASCDFLDKEPTYLTPQTYFTNESEAFSFLTGVYSILQQSPFYGNEYLYLIGGDDLGHFGGVGRTPRVGGLICNNASSGDPTVSMFWFLLYSGIDRANTFIESVDATPTMEANVKAQYKAEARFLRAFYYFNLVECWGDVPFRTSSTQSVNGLSAPRVDKQIIYDFIVKEMSEAANDLKKFNEMGNKPGRITKSAAWGTLARVYLFRAGECYRDNQTPDETKRTEYFKEASKYGQLVMGEGHELVDDYWRIFIDLSEDKYNSTGKYESIWEAEMAGNRSTDVRVEGRIGNVIGIQGPDLSITTLSGKENPGFGYAFIWTTPKLLEIYEANGDTERCDWNIAPFAYTQLTSGTKAVNGRKFEFGKKGTLKYPCFEYGAGDVENTQAQSDQARSRTAAKYRREYEAEPKSKNDTPINFPILRYADVLLMIAEAENEVNSAPNTLAYQCLNDVRERVGIAKLENIDKDAFREAIKNERAMELCFEYTRRFDLIRWGEYVSKMNEQVSIALAGNGWPQGKINVWTYFRISSAYNYFPIPLSEMAVNKEITKNNPGW